MASYSFKSVGKTQLQTDAEKTVATPVPFGIKTPMQIGTTEGILSMNYSLEDQFADNLRNLLLTNWGERVGLYQFGANLRPLTTEFTNLEDFDTRAIERIRGAVERWMPFVDLETFASTPEINEHRNVGVIRINITYNIPALSATKRALQIVLYVL